jgi:hypothetical protein
MVMATPSCAGNDCITGLPVPQLGACSTLQMFTAMFDGNSSGQPNASGTTYTGPIMQEPVCDVSRLPDLTMQGQILMAWRNSLGVGNYQPVLASWGIADPCAFGWAGVECENGTVVGLSLAIPSSNVPQDGGPGHVPPTYANGNLNWQVLRNLTGLRVLGLQVN